MRLKVIFFYLELKIEIKESFIELITIQEETKLILKIMKFKIKKSKFKPEKEISTKNINDEIIIMEMLDNVKVKFLKVIYPLVRKLKMESLEFFLLLEKD